MSHNINDLGALWKSRNTPPPNVAALMEAARAFRRKHIVKLVRTNLMLLATTAWVLYIVYAWNPQMLTTRIGVGLIITGMLGYLVVYNRLLPLLLRVPEQANSARYLQQLHTLQLWQKMLHYTATHLYFLLLWGGVVG
ncbi:MAG: hypothetical protein EBZ77_15085, partial [Chitinophagia bacterium]|nr:hypothetical protein [Chitinophagia bacterium]